MKKGFFLFAFAVTLGGGFGHLNANIEEAPQEKACRILRTWEASLNQKKAYDATAIKSSLESLQKCYIKIYDRKLNSAHLFRQSLRPRYLFKSWVKIYEGHNDFESSFYDFLSWPRPSSCLIQQQKAEVKTLKKIFHQLNNSTLSSVNPLLSRDENVYKKIFNSTGISDQHL